MDRFIPAASVLVLTLTVSASSARAQQQATAVRVARITAEPASVQVTRGGSATITLRALDAAGRAVTAPLRVGGAVGSLVLRQADGGRWSVTGLEVGQHAIIVSAVADGDSPAELRVPVIVKWPAVTRVEVAPTSSKKLYASTRLQHRARAFHADGSERPYPEVTWSSSTAAVATVDPYGHVRAVGAGQVTIRAEVEGVAGTLTHEVAPLGAASIELNGGRDPVRTGDVQTFDAIVKDANGNVLADVPVTWSHVFTADDSVKAPAAQAQIQDGRFVADVVGVYTVMASAGPAQTERSFRVERRDVVRKVEVMAQGRESRVFTTDFWVFEGVDGRDYAFTGSKMGDGVAFVLDVTDPSRIFKTDSIQVDARTVNDVKVSPDGRYAALSREGASNRRNGVVILDLKNPAHPTIASVYDEGLTGGVHNMFATNDHLFALSNGDKYVILDVRDLTKPTYVSEYDHPDSRVHDVWVHDGIAYSAEWATGVVVVDVGNGRWGGTIEKPKFVTAFPLPTGSTHAVFPYHQASTGKFYLFVGDERVQRNGLAWEGTGPDHRVPYDPATAKGGYPRATSGYIQVVDFTNPADPRMVARYEVREYGTHNLWVEDDILYQAYYEGGVRMV
ncbi:MAG: Ig-like domain-containing protein, partial [Longimicrobiales bacterium]